MNVGLSNAYQFAVGGARYLSSKLSTIAAVHLEGGLKGEDAVELDRPFLGVVGFNGKPRDTAYLLAHLTEQGRNGGRPYYLQQGKIYADPKLRHELGPEFHDPAARVFQVIPEHSQQSPEVTADQLDQALHTIEQVTGQDRADVAAHSMGGLGARLYRNRGGQGIARLLMVGTPNQGLHAAHIANWALHTSVGSALVAAGWLYNAGPALEWMEEGSPRLAELNGHWAEDKTALEDAAVVGARGRHTASAQGSTSGDGLVPESSLALPNTPCTVLPGHWTQGHISLMNDRETFHEMRDFFHWGP